MDHATLHGKPFGNCVLIYNYNYSEGLSNPARLLTNQIACFTAVIIYNVCSQLGLYILKQFQVTVV